MVQLKGSEYERSVLQWIYEDTEDIVRHLYKQFDDIKRESDKLLTPPKPTKRSKVSKMVVEEDEN